MPLNRELASVDINCGRLGALLIQTEGSSSLGHLLATRRLLFSGDLLLFETSSGSLSVPTPAAAVIAVTTLNHPPYVSPAMVAILH